MVGLWFWYDEAEPRVKALYHGQVAAEVAPGWFLLRFDDADALPDGAMEVVGVDRMAAERWVFFEHERELREALGGAGE